MCDCKAVQRCYDREKEKFCTLHSVLYPQGLKAKDVQHFLADNVLKQSELKAVVICNRDLARKNACEGGTIVLVRVL